VVALFVGFHIAMMAMGSLGRPPHLREPVSVSDHYGAYLGVVQRWFMFSRVGRNTARIEVAIQVDGRWKDVFVERSRDATWNAREFDHYRFREYMNHLRGRKVRQPWRRFVPWVAELVLEEFPEADAVRVRAVGAVIPAPAVLKRHGGLRYRKVLNTQVVNRPSDSTR
jgi:hypothetical protein